MGGMNAPTCSPEKVSPFGESAVKVERPAGRSRWMIVGWIGKIVTEISDC